MHLLLLLRLEREREGEGEREREKEKERGRERERDDNVCAHLTFVYSQGRTYANLAVALPVDVFFFWVGYLISTIIYYYAAQHCNSQNFFHKI